MPLKTQAYSMLEPNIRLFADKQDGSYITALKPDTYLAIWA